jgi:phosphopantetheine adenylyltransferase
MASLSTSATPDSYLLLLTCPPFPSSFSSLKAAYEPALSLVLDQISKLSSSSSAAILEVALPCPHLQGKARGAESFNFKQTQKLLAGLYSLISHICSRDSIDIEGKGGVNVRILLIAYARDQRQEEETTCQVLQGPVVDLPTLALSQRPWKRIYSIESEEGEDILAIFRKVEQLAPARGVKSPPRNIERVRGGISIVAPESGASNLKRVDSVSDLKSHLVSVVGGTFDHLHAGHKLLLTMTAFVLPEEKAVSDKRRLIVGITEDELLVNKKFSEFLGSWDDRAADVIDFLTSIIDFRPQGSSSTEVNHISNAGPNGVAVHTTLQPYLRIECVHINDPFGPTITDESASALVISGETRSGGKAVNDKRKEKGWNSMEIFEVDVLDASGRDENEAGGQENFDDKISSTAIRRRWAERLKSQGGGGSSSL